MTKTFIVKVENNWHTDTEMYDVLRAAGFVVEIVEEVDTSTWD